MIREARGLTKEFQGFVAVDGIDLRVRRGTIHALIGPNGAGKTTVFNLLTRFLPATSGAIVYNGQDVTRLRPAAVAPQGVGRAFPISARVPGLPGLEHVRGAPARRPRAPFPFSPPH